jgi:hypothetical protein
VGSGPIGELYRLVCRVVAVGVAVAVGVGVGGGGGGGGASVGEVDLA